MDVDNRLDSERGLEDSGFSVRDADDAQAAHYRGPDDRGISTDQDRIKQDERQHKKRGPPLMDQFPEDAQDQPGQYCKICT